MLVDDLERAKAEPSEDYHLKYRLQSIFRRIRDGDFEEGELDSKLSEIEDSYPVIDVIEPYHRWTRDRDYRGGAEPALELFEEAYRDARERGWQNIADLCLQELVALEDETGRDVGDSIEMAVEFLETEFQGADISLGGFHNLVDLVVENCTRIDSELVERCIDECQSRRRLQHRNGKYVNERSTLEKIIQLKQGLDQDVETERQLLVKSYEQEVERPSKNSHKAAVLQEALNRCISFIDEEKEREWKRDIRRYNRKAVQSEFAEIGLDDDQAKGLEEEAEKNVERLKQFFRNIPAESQSSTHSLYCLLMSDGYLPSYELAESQTEGISIIDIVSHVTISPEGDPIQTTEGGLESSRQLPHSYTAMLRHYDSILAQALYELIEQGDLGAMDFIYLLSICQGLSVDKEAFLLDLIIAVFEERYTEAVFLGMPLIEGVTSQLLDYSGEAVTAVKEGDIEQASLGGLLNEVEERTSTDFGMYLKARYTEKAGLNLRNRVSHGQIRYVECQFGNAALILFYIFRIMIHLSGSEYRMVFGPPANTISKTRQQEN